MFDVVFTDLMLYMINTYRRKVDGNERLLGANEHRDRQQQQLLALPEMAQRNGEQPAARQARAGALAAHLVAAQRVRAAGDQSACAHHEGEKDAGQQVYLAWRWRCQVGNFAGSDARTEAGAAQGGNIAIGGDHRGGRGGGGGVVFVEQCSR